MERGSRRGEVLRDKGGNSKHQTEVGIKYAGMGFSVVRQSEMSVRETLFSRNIVEEGFCVILGQLLTIKQQFSKGFYCNNRNVFIWYEWKERDWKTAERRLGLLNEDREREYHISNRKLGFTYIII